MRLSWTDGRRAPLHTNEGRTAPAPLGHWRMTAYASGNFGKNLLWGALDVTLLFVMTDLMGVSPGAAGAIVLTSLVVDAALGPLAGVFADRLRTPLGRFGPLILVGAPLSGMSFVLLFALPVLEVGDAVVISLVLMAFRFGYALVDLPHNALLAVASTNSRERNRIAGYRFFFSTLASLVLALALAPTLGAAAGDGATGMQPDNLFVFACSIALVGSIVIVAAWFAVRRYDRSVEPATAPPASFKDRLGALAGSRPYVVALIAAALATLFLPLFNKSLLYLGQYVLGDVSLAPRILSGVVIGQFAGLPLWIWLSSRLEKARCLQLSHGVCIAGFAGMLVLAANESMSATLIAAGVLVGIGAGGVYSIIWSMISDCVEAIHAATGIRADSLVFAIAIFLQKAAIGVGAAAFGQALAVSGYEPTASAAAPVTTTILWFNLGLPIVGSALCIALLAYYDLTHDRHAAFCIDRAS